MRSQSQCSSLDPPPDPEPASGARRSPGVLVMEAESVQGRYDLPQCLAAAPHSRGAGAPRAPLTAVRGPAPAETRPSPPPTGPAPAPRYRPASVPRPLSSTHISATATSPPSPAQPGHPTHSQSPSPRAGHTPPGAPSIARPAQRPTVLCPAHPAPALPGPDQALCRGKRALFRGPLWVIFLLRFFRLGEQ